MPASRSRAIGCSSASGASISAATSERSTCTCIACALRSRSRGSFLRSCAPSMASATSSCADSGSAERGLARAMLATVAHELRTPLTSIRGYIETLLEGELDPATARRFLETARREALRVSRLVDGMLEFSLFDLASGDLRAECDTTEQIRATLETLSPLAAARRVTIRTSLLADAKARVDDDAFFHALSNLVENAIKYVGENGT